jgi:hypothetical protein
MSSAPSNQDTSQDFLEELSKLSPEERDKLIPSLKKLRIEQVIALLESSHDPKKSYSETKISDRDRHMLLIKQIDRMIEKINKSIAEMEELKKQREILLEVS